MFLDHYYGDYVRRLFLVGGGVMLATLPFLQLFIPYNIFTSIIAIVGLVLCAGLLAPNKKWVAVLDMLVAAGSTIIFEYYAVNSYLESHIAFFVANQFLAIIFLSAFYYAVKTVRGSFGRS